MGIKLVAKLGDLNQSGGTMNRPGMNAAVDMVVTGKADTILVAKVDRFARNVKEGLATLDLIESHGGSVVCGDLDVDTRTTNGRMMFIMLLNMAEAERGRRREGFAESTAAATRDGVRISPPPPGYKLDRRRRLVVDRRYARLIPQMFERRAAGGSWKSLREWWHDETGEWLRLGRFVGLIRNRTYLGELNYGGVTSPVRHTALVDEELFRAANVSRALRPGRAPSGPTLLAGILYCSGCGRPMTTSRGGAYNVRIYKCQKHGRAGLKCPGPVSIICSRADAWVEEQFLAWAGGVEGRTTGDRHADFVAADARIADAERELVAFMAAFSSVVGVEEAGRQAADRKAEVDAAVAARDELHTKQAVASARFKVADEWPSLTVEERRRMLDAGIERIDVTAASFTAAGGRRRMAVNDRLHILWRAD
jgi:DNA invertase Pin-like site-specific DNA recombinase